MSPGTELSLTRPWPPDFVAHMSSCLAPCSIACGVGKAQNGSAVVSTVSGIGIYPFSRCSTTLRMLARYATQVLEVHANIGELQ